MESGLGQAVPDRRVLVEDMPEILYGSGDDTTGRPRSR